MILHKHALAVRHACSRDDIRLTSVHLTADGAEASNGFIAARSTKGLLPTEDWPVIAGPTTDRDSLGANIPRAALDTAIKTLPKRNDSLTILRDGVCIRPLGESGDYEIVTTDLKTTQRAAVTATDNFPNLTSVFDSTRRLPLIAKVCLSIEQLELLCQMAKELGRRKGTVTLTLRAPEDDARYLSDRETTTAVEFQMHSLDSETKIEGLVMPCRE